jgi:hypothetical protein
VVTPLAKPQFTYAEDRSAWVPSHRIRQESERAAKLERDLEFERQRVAALSGVKHTPAPNPEADAIRNQLFQVAPELKELFEFKEMLGELKGLNLKETIAELRASHNQSWTQRGNQTLTALENGVREAYGVAGKDLSPKALQRIQRAFVSELQEDDAMRERYEAGDASVVTDFVKDFTGVVLDPYRRSTASAPAAGREAARRLPRGGGGQAASN